jgi:hypothetical protein
MSGWVNSSAALASVNGTAVLDDHLLSDFRVSFSNVVTDEFVNRLSLSRSRRFAGTDSPYWFVSDNHAFEWQRPEFSEPRRSDVRKLLPFCPLRFLLRFHRCTELESDPALSARRIF